MVQLPTLFKINSRGKIQLWIVSAEGNLIVSKYGQLRPEVDGYDYLTKSERIATAKNVGRANHRDPEAQAIFEVNSKWKKRITSGYAEYNEGTIKKCSVPGSYEINVQNKFIFPISPMLAKQYKNAKHKIVYPVLIQPKIDGNRGVISLVEGKIHLHSRGQKPIMFMDHILEKAKEVFAIINMLIGNTDIRNCPFHLDGELYTEKKLQDLTSIIRQKTTKHADSKHITFQIFDFADNEKYNNLQRMHFLANLFSDRDAFSPIEFVGFEVAKDADDIMKAHSIHMKDGHEGTIIRNCSGIYRNKIKYRSSDLIKYKDSFDTEVKIIGFKAAQGNQRGAALFIVQEHVMKDKKHATGWSTVWPDKYEKDNPDHLQLEYTVTPKDMTINERIEVFNNQDKYLGKWITISFFDRYKSGKTQFCNMVRFRDPVEFM
jgi:ATP-dependent DNA ligase